ncbi:MAG: hypothetical protein MUC72_08305 [Acidobacteria bacterium]|jgi:hypothetical protein|nr:hypothetical protein [Acidobacteriota bacterium]
MNAVFWLYLVFALALLNWLIGVIALRSFLARVPAITGPLDLESFAALVRVHMLQAMLQAGLLLAGMLLGIFVLADGQAGLLLVLALNGAILAAGWIGKPLEERARTLKVADPLLEERYKAICVAWVKKPFPDF